MIFHLRLLPGKTNDIIFQTLQKTPFLSHFAHFRVKQSFPQNFATYRCAKLKKKPSTTTGFQALVSDGRTPTRRSMNFRTKNRSDIFSNYVLTQK